MSASAAAVNSRTPMARRSFFSGGYEFRAVREPGENIAQKTEVCDRIRVPGELAPGDCADEAWLRDHRTQQYTRPCSQVNSATPCLEFQRRTDLHGQMEQGTMAGTLDLVPLCHAGRTTGGSPVDGPLR